MNLNTYFKQHTTLFTKIGEFEFLAKEGVKHGGNSNVLFFRHKNSGKEFAIKFLTEWVGNERKMKRFIDEYFALIQVPPHKNIVRQYHLDSFKYKDDSEGELELSFIIMRKYSSSLKERKISEYDGFEIILQIGGALRHLHNFGVIHRDVKPENIFYDDDLEEYVLGDFGIAHFNEEFVAKLSHTKNGERLANFSFSPEESVKSGGEVRPASDIYSLGQVIQWWYTGQASKGAGRPSFGDIKNIKDKALNSVVDKAIQSDISQRYQSLDELLESFNSFLEPLSRDIFMRLRDLDELFRSSFPKIKSIYVADKKNEIERFVINLNKKIINSEFWWMNLKGGDYNFLGLEKIDDHFFLLNKRYEVKIDKIIVYLNESRIYESFFILLVSPNDPFHICNEEGDVIERSGYEEWICDVACFYNDQYMDPDLFRNGYLEINNEVHKVGIDDYCERERSLIPYAYMICPDGAGPSSVMDRKIVTDMLHKVLNSGELETGVLNEYLERIRPYHSHEFKYFD